MSSARYSPPRGLARDRIAEDFQFAPAKGPEAREAEAPEADEEEEEEVEESQEDEDRQGEDHEGCTQPDVSVRIGKLLSIFVTCLNSCQFY